MKKDIILITNSFPYLSGEEFLESEIKYWEKDERVNLTIMPLNSGSDKRDISPLIGIDLSVSNLTSKYVLCASTFVRILFTFVFYREMFTHVFKEPGKFKYAVISLIKFYMYKIALKKTIEKNGRKNILFYTYWHTEATYALQELKKDYEFELITRTHRYDLYKESRVLNYMPLKQQFLSGINKIYTITESASKYLVSTYGFDQELLAIARLGVVDLGIKCKSSSRNRFNIVSCSYIVPVKRIEKIVDAIYLLSLQNAEVDFLWTHLGAGDLKGKIERYAGEKLSNTNVAFEFLGQLPNHKIYEFYKENSVDVFLNVSESEGVPVSIMEAMSCYIPVVAPNVGGVCDMIVSGFNGCLLSDKAEVSEIVEALSDTSFFKDQRTRSNAFSMFELKYDADKNYPEWVDRLTSD